MKKRKIKSRISCYKLIINFITTARRRGSRLWQATMLPQHVYYQAHASRLCVGDRVAGYGRKSRELTLRDRSPPPRAIFKIKCRRVICKQASVGHDGSRNQINRYESEGAAGVSEKDVENRRIIMRGAGLHPMYDTPARSSDGNGSRAHAGWRTRRYEWASDLPPLDPLFIFHFFSACATRLFIQKISFLFV